MKASDVNATQMSRAGLPGARSPEASPECSRCGLLLDLLGKEVPVGSGARGCLVGVDMRQCLVRARVVMVPVAAVTVVAALAVTLMA